MCWYSVKHVQQSFVFVPYRKLMYFLSNFWLANYGHVTFPITWILTSSRVWQVNETSVREYSLALAERLFLCCELLWTNGSRSYGRHPRHVLWTNRNVIFVILYIFNTVIRRCVKLKILVWVSMLYNVKFSVWKKVI